MPHYEVASQLYYSLLAATQILLAPRISGEAIYPADVLRLERALRMHLHQLRTSLVDPARDVVDLHLAMAPHLRALLCDANAPILIVCAEYKKLSLPIWGPFPAGFTPPSDCLAMTFNALVASSNPVLGGYQMTIEQYLDTPIGAVPFTSRDGLTEQTVWYTPRQVIKWVANKDGGAHFDLETPPNFDGIRSSLSVVGQVSYTAPGVALALGSNDDFVVRSAIVQISTWAVRAAETVLDAPPPPERDAPAPTF